MVKKTVKIRTDNFTKKETKIIGINVYQNSNPAKNDWIKEQTFLGMETFRYEKLESK
jgi:methylmalonyl-CoA mutase N-terminal domain/subunit